METARNLFFLVGVCFPCILKYFSTEVTKHLSLCVKTFSPGIKIFLFRLSVFCVLNCILEEIISHLCLSGCLALKHHVCLDEQRARVKGSGVVTGSSIIMVALKDLSGVCKQRAVNCERRNSLNRQG